MAAIENLDVKTPEQKKAIAEAAERGQGGRQEGQ